MKNLFVVALIPFLMYGCKQTSEKSLSIGLRTSINQAEQVADDLTIRVKSLNDSRCPEGCECFWAGEVRVFFTIKDNVQTIDTSLILTSRPNIHFKSYIITLKEVNPYPICNYQNPRGYTFYFQVDDLNKETLH